MKKKNTKIMEEQVSDFSEKKISRKEAIKKTGYMAASTATMMILLNENAQGMMRDPDRRRNRDRRRNHDCPATSP